MAPRWSIAALAAAAFSWAGVASADMQMYSNLAEYDAKADKEGGFPSQRFRSSDIVAPVFHVNSFEPDLIDDAGYMFLGTVYGSNHGGPMIFDAKDLSLVYADQQYINTYSSNVQYINGTRYLTFWEGAHSRGHANGFCLFFDEDYNLVFNVTSIGTHDEGADMHEMNVTPDGNVIFTTYFNLEHGNLSAIGGPADTIMMDSGFQEVDPATNRLIFEWTASKHFRINDTFARYGKGFGLGVNSGFDFSHINSVDKSEDGNYLVSSRHLSLLTLINGTSGDPIWVLGGRHNQFKDLSDGMATNFGWQHAARFYKNTSHITMFDNHGEHTGECGGDKPADHKCLTRALHLEIDTDAMTARVVNSYYHPAHINSGAMGGVEVLESGNVVSGWGYNPGIVEYTREGKVVMDIQRGRLAHHVNDMFAYRAHKGDWNGMAKGLPSIAVDSPNGNTHNASVYLSWNGATKVAKWAVLGTDKPREISGHRNLIAESKRNGFESSIFLDASHTASRYLAAAALDKDDGILGSTLILDMQTGKPHLMESNIGEVHPPAKPAEPEEKPKVDEKPQGDEKEKGDEKEEEEEEEEEPSVADQLSDSGYAGAILLGGTAVIFAVVFGLVWVIYMVRRGRAPDIDDTRYEKVDASASEEELPKMVLPAQEKMTES